MKCLVCDFILETICSSMIFFLFYKDFIHDLLLYNRKKFAM